MGSGRVGDGVGEGINVFAGALGERRGGWGVDERGVWGIDERGGWRREGTSVSIDISEGRRRRRRQEEEVVVALGRGFPRQVLGSC